MAESEIRVETPDGRMTTFVAHPDGAGPFPVALLYMDGVGYREQLKENARRFASAGYYVVAPDLFYRSGEGLGFDFSRMGDPAYAARLREVLAAVTPDGVVADTEALLDVAADDPSAAGGDKVCVGYCMGARHALHAAAAKADELVALAGIHPSALVTDQPDSPHHDVAALRADVYFAFAENDRTATPENVALFRAELERHGVAGDVERLPGTSHGFAMADLPVYDEAACERHFERTLDLWGRALGKTA